MKISVFCWFYGCDYRKQEKNKNVEFDNFLSICESESFAVICSPSNLEKKEHLFIHKFKTLYPIGLNKYNPFGLAVIT